MLNMHNIVIFEVSKKLSLSLWVIEIQASMFYDPYISTKSDHLNVSGHSEFMACSCTNTLKKTNKRYTLKETVHLQKNIKQIIFKQILYIKCEE